MKVRLHLQLLLCVVELLDSSLGAAYTHLLRRCKSEAIGLTHDGLLLVLRLLLLGGRALLLPTETLDLALNLIRHEVIRRQRREVFNLLLI